VVSREPALVSSSTAKSSSLRRPSSSHGSRPAKRRARSAMSLSPPGVSTWIGGSSPDLGMVATREKDTGASQLAGPISNEPIKIRCPGHQSFPSVHADHLPPSHSSTMASGAVGRTTAKATRSGAGKCDNGPYSGTSGSSPVARRARGRRARRRATRGDRGWRSRRHNRSSQIMACGGSATARHR
jgi:hypothetical protein